MDDPATPTERSFWDIVAVHEALLELVLRHQEALVERDLAEARRRWDAFVRAQRSHIEAEDEVLLPVFANSGEEILGCSSELLFQEHRKIERLVRRLDQRLAIFERAGKLTPRDVVYMVEEERMLKEVLDHHDIREKAGFLPALDRLLDGEKRAEAWRQVDAIHARGFGTVPGR